MEKQSHELHAESGHLMDVVDRMAHEASMVEYLQYTSQNPDLEGVLSVLAERMRATKEMLQEMIQSGPEEIDS